jgi:hypothetical protein
MFNASNECLCLPAAIAHKSNDSNIPPLNECVFNFTRPLPHCPAVTKATVEPKHKRCGVIHVSQAKTKVGEKVSRLSLIDLAGSERVVSKTLNQVG